MREEEPLEGWLFHIQMYAEHGPPPYPKGTSRAALDQLAQALAAPPGAKVSYHKIAGGTFNIHSPRWIKADEVTEAEQLFLQVWERGGAGASYVIEGLLQSIALALQPASLPFWRLLLDLSRPRDQSATMRRTLALAAMALLAIERDAAEAYQALADALRHPHEQVRALAGFYIAQAYAVPDRPPSASVESALTHMAALDRAFTPRFQARAALGIMGRPVPLDNPETVYFLKVQLRGDRATRTIAILAEHTLSDLHDAIQEAFGWDADHLYSFYMSGDRKDQRYEIRCPELDDSWGFGIWSMTAVEAENEEGLEQPEDDDMAAAEEMADAEDDDSDLYTTNALIGALGLVPKHRFIYFFDYGDSHEFIVTVLGIEARADDGAYPRLIESHGEAPQQYYAYGDEDSEEDI